MTEIAIALDHPAMTPEVRAWISHRPGRRSPALVRGRLGDRGVVVLRIDVDGASEAQQHEEIEALLTDMRMLGLAPKLLEHDPA